MVIFAILWSFFFFFFYSMWMKVERGKKKKKKPSTTDIVWIHGKLSIHWGEEKKRKKKVFPAKLQIDLMFLRYHMAYFWVHSRAILLYLCKRKKERWSVALAQRHFSHMLGKQTVCQLGTGQHKHTECRNSSRSNTVASSPCLHYTLNITYSIYCDASYSLNCLPQPNLLSSNLW